ncbi:rubrerythrin-like domain-containing protein [Halorubrum pallidum]|uniref:Rubrerythrin-like domain-containing protein n=1 Tax=Halorubrum pallidum TaxID=1526114 RepID=A0ABD5T4Y2_9EURY
MRPECNTGGEELYECFDCGFRCESGGTCPTCDGELRHLGRSRDL